MPISSKCVNHNPVFIHWIQCLPHVLSRASFKMADTHKFEDDPLAYLSDYKFNDNFQVGSTAMGTRVAPSYANLFMGHLEKSLSENALHKLDIYLYNTVTALNIKFSTTNYFSKTEAVHLLSQWLECENYPMC